MQEISSNELLSLIQYFLLRLRQCLIFRTLQWVRSAAPIIIHVNLDRVLKFLVDDTHYRNRFETGTSGGSTDIVARKSLEVRIWAMKRKKEKNPTLSKQLEIIGVLEAMPERKNQGTSRVVEDDWFASGSTLEAFPCLFVSVHFFKISYSLFTFSDKFRSGIFSHFEVQESVEYWRHCPPQQIKIKRSLLQILLATQCALIIFFLRRLRPYFKQRLPRQ